MDYNYIKEFARTHQSDKEVFVEAILELVRKTEGDEDFDINTTGARIIYRCFVVDPAISGEIQISSIVDYIKLNRVSKDNYQKAILECIQGDIERKIWY